jgi:electron transfer flavoprotein alpha subunit
MTRIGVLIEERDGEIKKANLGVLTVARRHPASEVWALVFGPHVESRRAILERYGADKILAVRPPPQEGWERRPEAKAMALSLAIEALQMDVLLGLASLTGKELLARVASLKGAPLVLDCLDADLATGVVRKSHFSGRTQALIRLRGRPWIVGMRPNAIAAMPAPRRADVVEYQPAVEDKQRLLIKEIKRGSMDTTDLAEAEIIISGGRALGSAENFAILKEGASLLGAAVGASRAAVDAGFAAHALQVGQTGKTVSPRLYIACGISGSIQHFAGMKTSHVIVAVNKDPEAQIMNKCDYALIGDLFEVIPALTQALKAERESGFKIPRKEGQDEWRRGGSPTP